MDDNTTQSDVMPQDAAPVDDKVTSAPLPAAGTLMAYDRHLAGADETPTQQAPDATPPTTSDQTADVPLPPVKPTIPATEPAPTPLVKGALDDPQLPANVVPESAAPSDFKINDLNTGWHFGQMDGVKGMIVHHTGGEGDVQGVIDTLNQRHLGVQFVVDRNGSVYRLMPEGSKGLHMMNGWGAGAGLSNNNMQGVEVIARNDKDVLPAQVAAVKNLVAQQSKLYGYNPQTSVFGHGEVNPGHKEADEGMSSVNVIRNGAPLPQGPATSVNVPSDVMAVLRQASDRTGVNINTLVSVAKQESGFDPMSGAGKGGDAAVGLFNFKPKTWQWALQQWGDVHGIPANTPPTNAQANAILGAEYLRYGQQQIASQTGRYKNGEVYLTHFLGPTGGTNFIRLAESNPTAAAADYFPKAAAANRSVFFNKDGSPRSVQDIYNWGVKIGGGDASISPVGTGTNAGGASAPAALGAGAALSAQSLPPIRSAGQAVMQEDAQKKLQDDASYLDLIGDTFKLDTITGTALAFQHFDPNPGTIPPADDIVKKWQAAGIPDNIIQRDIPNIVSGQHEQWMFSRAQQETDQANQMSQLGIGGYAASMLTQMLDPPTLAATIASGSLADIAVASRGLGMAARMAAQGVAGAGVNLGLAGLESQLGNSTALDHPAFTIAAGAVLGSLAGIGRNPYVAKELMDTAHAAEGEVARMQGIAHENSVGAASNPNVDAQFLDDKAILAHPGVPETAMKQVRGDMAAEANKSGLKTAQVYGNAIFADAIGPKDKTLVNPFTVDQDKNMKFEGGIEKMNNFLNPAFDEWATANNVKPWERPFAKAKFEDQVYEVQAGMVEGDRYGPAVKRAADKLNELYRNDAHDLQNVWRKEGGQGRPLEGFENGPPIDNYSPAVTNYAKASRLIKEGGTSAVEAIWSKAIRSGMAEYGLSEEAMDDMAHNISRNVQSRANGVWENFEKAQGNDKGALIDFLRESGVSGKTLEEVSTKFPDANSTLAQASKDARTKRRLPVDRTAVVENFRMKDGSVRNLSFKDIMETSPSRLYTMYNNWKSGRMALMRMRIRNPETGELLVDGIHTQADWDAKVIENIKKEAVEKNIGPDKTRAMLDMFNFAHDRLLGRPNPAQQTVTARVLRTIRDYNVTRLLGNLGFTHMTQAMLATGSLGFKAMLQQMPALRTIVENGDRVPANKLMREIIAFTGNDGTAFHSFSNLRIDDYGWIPGSGGPVQGALDVGKQWMSQISGFNLVNKFLMQGTQRAIAQKFSDLASKALKDGGIADLSKINTGTLNRLRSVGLSDDMLKRVLSEMVEHREVSQSAMALFGAKLHALNLHNWTDLEARAHFEQALYSWSRRLILHNDLGNMARWMSSPVAQAVMQFRTFIANAWAKVTLYNLHQRDMSTFTTFTYSMLMASAMYAAREQARSIGRSDRDEYLQRKLAPDEIVKGAMQMTPITSIIPMLVDTPLMLAGYKGAFDARSTGQATDAVFGSPVMSFGADLGHALAGIIQPITQGYDRSQPEYRNIARVLPFSNTVPFNAALSAMISGAPEKEPRVPKEQKKLF